MQFQRYQLLNAMLDRNISQTKLAKLTGISRYTIIKYCAGTSVPRVDNLVTLASVLDKDIYYFFDAGTEYAKVIHAHYEVVPNQHKNQVVPDVRCSNCHRVLKHKKENYCSHCGAKFDKERK